MIDLFNIVSSVFGYILFGYFVNKLKYYTKNINEAKQIAMNGWRKGHNNFNDRAVTKYFLEVAFSGKPISEYGWPIHQFFK